MLPTIIDYVHCDSCDGNGEVQNSTFLNLDPIERLRRANEGLVSSGDLLPTIKCPFCDDGQAPIYECEDCAGEGCPECDGQGWYQ